MLWSLRQDGSNAMTTPHAVVDHKEWLAQRRKLLAKEKRFTRLRDELSQLRRDLPWEEVTKPYAFEGAGGQRSLGQLFDGRSQLIVYHFMFGPDWDAGCPHCSRWADNFNPVIVHLNHRDVTMVAVSHAPFAKLRAYRRRMGWSFDWYSSSGSDFNFDFNVSFTPEEMAAGRATYNFVRQDPGVSEREGVSVFCKGPRGRIFHTYSAFARGIDLFATDYNYLDITPQGRNEKGRGPYWVRRHDEYPTKA
jgi:predicted dithiol-disulfide oxidoreductase (DUF899 family)